MEKTQLLNKIFDILIDEIKLEKEDLILSVKKNEYKFEKYKKYKKCSRIKSIVAHLFLMAILKNSHSQILNLLMKSIFLLNMFSGTPLL
jgi:hypothetical protein